MLSPSSALCRLSSVLCHKVSHTKARTRDCEPLKDTNLEPNTHIIRDEMGIARIDQTQIKVMDLAMDSLAYGWSADAIHEQYPDLTMAQIHAALAYYYDHQAEFDAEMVKDLKIIKQWRTALGDSPLQRRMRMLALQK